MKSSRKPRTINRQIAGMIIILVLVSLLICVIANSFFLGDFYYRQKEKNMVEIYNYLQNHSDEENIYSTGFAEKFDNYYGHDGISVLVTQSNGSVKLCYGGDASSMVEQLHYCLFSNDDSRDIKKSGNSYEVFVYTYTKTSEEYIAMVGTLSDGNLVYMRVSGTAISETTKIANNFLFLTSIATIIICITVGLFLVRYFTNSIFELISITKRITDFDFTAKYTPQKYYNEIDDLGEHVNEMSTTLERAIVQLRKANESLLADLHIREENEQMRKDFISNVSHELKTPIALIQGYAEGLQEGIMDDAESRQIYLDVIIDEANKMSRLVKEMLILNQLEAGQMSADFDVFDITVIIKGVMEANKLNYEAQGILLDFDTDEPCMVKSDEFLVEQVFTNFMSNAIHYVTNENIIRVHYEYTKKNKVRISVFNTGNNIPKKDIKHIWDKFYKVDKARSREYGGSGIGLSVVKATMDLLHEKFGVENEPNGVTFWFDLALAKDVKI